MSIITRLEIIDHRPCKSCKGSGIAPNGAPCVVCYGCGIKGQEVLVNPGNGVVVTYQEQDDGRTLKVFLKEAPTGKDNGR